MSRILVAEDELRIASFVEKGLRANGFSPTVVSDGATALGHALSGDFDLLVLDLGLPGMDGVAVVSALRAMDHDVPVCVLSARDTVDDRVVGLEAGADDYVVKPYLIDELLARVRALLRRTGRLASQVSQVGRLVVDEPAHRVMVGQTVVDLGPTDFALLAVLARHAGQVLSKSRLLELVWGYEAVDENLVEVHVSILRRRLGKDAHLIHTVRGVGYVLRDSNPVELQDP
jgi:DNA-binding response OmpR family regulator